MSDCIGPTNIIPNNNQVILQDVNRTITVIDNNCCTDVTVTQPVTTVVQVNTPGPRGLTGPSAPFTEISPGIWSTPDNIQITGSLEVVNGITGSLLGTASYSETASYSTTLGATLGQNIGPDFVELYSSDGTLLGFVQVNFVQTANYADNAAQAFQSNWIYISQSNDLPPVLYPTLVISCSTGYYPLQTNSSSLSYIPSTNTLTATSSYAITASYALNGGGGGGGTPGGSDTQIQFNNTNTFDGSPNFTFDYNTNTVTLTGSLTVSSSNTLTNIGPAIFSGSLIVTNGITGSLFGTSSWAESSSRAISSSFALTASFAPNYVLNSATSSFVTNSQTSSFSTGSFTGSFTGSLFGTSSWAIQALTASYITGSVFTSNNLALSSSHSITSSYSLKTVAAGTTGSIQFNSSSILGGNSNLNYVTNLYTNTLELNNGQPVSLDTESFESGIKLYNSNTNGFTNTFTTSVEAGKSAVTTICSLDSTKILGLVANYTIIDVNDILSLRTGTLNISFDGTNVYFYDLNNYGNGEAIPSLAIFEVNYAVSPLARLVMKNDSNADLRVLINMTTFTINPS